MAAQDDRVAAQDDRVAARIVEEWRRDVLGLGIGGGRHTQQRRLMVKIVSVAAKC